VDIDRARIQALSQGRAPFREPGLDPLLRRGLRSGRLRFTTSLREAARFGDVHFLCVGNPAAARPSRGRPQPALRLRRRHLAPLLARPCLVAGKSNNASRQRGRAGRPGGRAGARQDRGRAGLESGIPARGHAVDDTLDPARDRRRGTGFFSRHAEGAVLARQSTARPLVGRDSAAGQPTWPRPSWPRRRFTPSGHQDLLHQRDGRGYVRGRGPTSQPLAGYSARIPGSARPGDESRARFGGGCACPRDLRALLARAEALVRRAVTVVPARRWTRSNARCRSRAVAAARDLAGGSLAGQAAGVARGTFSGGFG